MNPVIIRWAREKAGLSLEEAASALQLSAASKLEQLELGTEPPTRSVLLKMSKVYRRSLLTFYLEVPPRTGDRGHDFRTLPSALPPSENAFLDALLRDIKARQDMVRAIVEDGDDVPPLSFIGQSSIGDGVPATRQSICERLNIDVSEYRKQKTVEDAFAYLRNCAEANGIFVLLVGNLGSHHTTISVEAFRGYAIADPFAPFILINDQDAKTAWSFTLLHEIAHLWLGVSGISGISSEQEVEKFCNEVASTILLPRADLATLGINDQTPLVTVIEAIGAFAKDRHLSKKLVAYVLFTAGHIRQTSWKKIDYELTSLWNKERQRQRDKGRTKLSGPNYYTVRRHRLGPALLTLVNRSMRSGGITPVKAAKVLGVRPRNVTPLLSYKNGNVIARGSP
jgi:Zn-dependent peptidase ImmA (M78 family)/transcriptional regulator with XRE-family HTH domain